MIRFLPYFVELALLVFCLIDCIQSPPHQIRNLDKVVWILLIVFIPIIGGVAWLVAGRPQRAPSSSQQWRMGNGFSEASRQRSTSPDDDPAFLRSINVEQESTLKKWEDDLKAREAKLRAQEKPPTTPGDGQPGA
jgi:hypothetical protein